MTIDLTAGLLFKYFTTAFYKQLTNCKILAIWRANLLLAFFIIVILFLVYSLKK